MRFELRLTAYDMLDVVQVVLMVHSTAPDAPEPILVLRRVVAARGEGIDVPHEWARDALISALETL